MQHFCFRQDINLRRIRSPRPRNECQFFALLNHSFAIAVCSGGSLRIVLKIKAS